MSYDSYVAYFWSALFILRIVLVTSTKVTCRQKITLELEQRKMSSKKTESNLAKQAARVARNQLATRAGQKWLRKTR